MLRLTKVFHRIVEYIKSGKVIIFCRGGTSSSKTWSILQVLIRRAQNGHQVNIIGLSYVHLRLGIIRDMQLIAPTVGIDWSAQYKVGTNSLLFPGGGIINFISVDKIDKAHGLRSGDLYINECNYHSWEIVDQLLSRTSGLKFLDCNPSARFWIIDKILENPKWKDVAIEDVSTYKDNEFLDASVVAAIEAHDPASNWWRVYGLGQWGIHEGLIFDNFKIQEFNKNQFGEYRYGVDWGFGTDPFAFVECAINPRENNLYICREIYGKGLLNQQTAPIVKDIAGAAIVMCDSAEPKSIADYQTAGINAIGADKGHGSVSAGIKYLQGYNQIIIHPDCVRVGSEFGQYSYKKNRISGEYIAEPIDEFNHGIDAIRYALNFDITSGDRYKPHLTKAERQAQIEESYNKQIEDVIKHSGKIIISTKGIIL
ncbi:MAG: terminase large subunit [Rickettsiales bacterium]|jgi:PBSX family phage terminase large subunit|nr:terminase large subunit [Rickettsiales bacterium]